MRARSNPEKRFPEELTATGRMRPLGSRNVPRGGGLVRVIARDPGRLPAHLRKQFEVVKGSHGDIDVVNQAFAGADAV